MAVSSCLRWGAHMRRSGSQLVLLVLATLAAQCSAQPTVLDDPAELIEPAEILDARNRLAHRVTEKRETGQYSSALAEIQQQLRLERLLLGHTNNDYLATLEQLAQLALRQADFAIARAARSEILRTRRRLRGEAHWRTIDARQRLAELDVLERMSADELADVTRAADLDAEVDKLGDAGEPERGLPLAREALAIRQRLLGPHHPDTLESLKNFGRMERDVYHHAEAERILKDVIRIRTEVLGPDHPETAYARNVLAWEFVNRSDYDAAEAEFLKGLASFESLGMERAEDLAMNLDNLSIVRRERGDLASAERYVRRALALRRRVLGTQHADYVTSLNNLANILQKRGDYAECDACLQEIVRADRAAGRDQTLAHATYLGNRAFIARALGDYFNAERFELEALALRLGLVGDDHLTVAWSYWNLGRLYATLGRLDEAEAQLQRALAIRERVLGRNHEDYADVLLSLSIVANQRQDFARAADFAGQAEQIYANTFGPVNQYRARSLKELGAALRAQGDLDAAQSVLLQSLAAYQATVGGGHPEATDCLSELAALDVARGDVASAESRLREALVQSRRHFEATSVALSERQQVALLVQQRRHLDEYLSCVVELPDHGDAAYEPVLRWKGAALIRQRAARIVAGRADVAPLWDELQQVTRQWAALAHTGGTPEQVAQRRAALHSLTDQREQLAAELSRRSTAYRQATTSPRPADLQAALPRGTVLVDYLEYTRLIPDAEHPGRFESVPSLLAFVVLPEAATEMFDLGPSQTVAAAVDVWRRSFGTAPDAVTAAGELRSKVWEPLAAVVQNADTILIAPDGALGRFPWGALPGRTTGTSLIEDHRLVLAPVPQLIPELLGARRPGLSASRLLLVGDVDYDHRAAAVSASALATDGASPPAVPQNIQSTWPALPGAKAETEFIRRTFQPAGVDMQRSLLVQSGVDATESAFCREAPRSQLLHLATHGFFATSDAPSDAGWDQLAAVSRSAGRSSSVSDQLREFQRINPGLLSGLVFAGANQTQEFAAGSNAAVDDGVLTSEEIACLPLSGVHLVVLSACETGLGAAAGGEGLLGIQRAFQVAGVQSTVATLWQVDDAVTRRLMEEFYQRLLSEQSSPLDALRDAQLWILKHPQEIERLISADAARGDRRLPAAATARKGISRTPPYYWAAFQLSGAWR